MGCRRHEGLTAQVRVGASRVLAPSLARCRTACPRSARGAPGGDWTPRGGRGCFRAPRAVPMRVSARPYRKRRAPCSRPLPFHGSWSAGARVAGGTAAFARETAPLGGRRICGLRPEVRPARASPVPTARAQLPVPPGPGRGPSPQVRPVTRPSRRSGRPSAPPARPRAAVARPPGPGGRGASSALPRGSRRLLILV